MMVICESSNEALKRTTAPLGSRTVLENFLTTIAADRRLPTVVAELGH